MRMMMIRIVMMLTGALQSVDEAAPLPPPERFRSNFSISPAAGRRLYLLSRLERFAPPAIRRFRWELPRQRRSAPPSAHRFRGQHHEMVVHSLPRNALPPR